MSRYIFLLIFLLNCVSYFVNAQKILSGKIVGNSGQPLASASVKLINANINTLTDDQGKFQIKLKAGLQRLQVSYIGYQTKTAELVTDTLKAQEIVIALQPTPGTLSNVSVSGVKRKSATATRTLLQIQDIPQAIVVMGQKVISNRQHSI